MLGPRPAVAQHSHVYALVGANMALRRKLLDDVGGFDEAMVQSEDEDLSRRIHRHLDGATFLYEERAHVAHHYRPGFADTVKRGRTYGRGSALIKRQAHEFPALFPFPLLTAAIFLATLLVRPRRISLAALAPLALYGGWWPTILRRRQPEALLYPYMQLLQESAQLLGAVSVLPPSAAVSPETSIILINKGDRRIADSLDAIERWRAIDAERIEVIVVDGSEHRLDDIAARFPEVRWIPFSPIEGRVTIPHQRNVGLDAARGGTIVFTDAGCIPDENWLELLTAPIELGAETVVAGSHRSPNGNSLRDEARSRRAGLEYVAEAPTINLAIRRQAHRGHRRVRRAVRLRLGRRPVLATDRLRRANPLRPRGIGRTRLGSHERRAPPYLGLRTCPGAVAPQASPPVAQSPWRRLAAAGLPALSAVPAGLRSTASSEPHAADPPVSQSRPATRARDRRPLHPRRRGHIRTHRAHQPSGRVASMTRSAGVVAMLFRSAMCMVLFRLAGASAGLVTCVGRLPQIIGEGRIRVVGLRYAPLGCRSQSAPMLRAPSKSATGCSSTRGAQIVAAISIRIGPDCRIGDFVAIHDSDYHPVEQNAPARKAPVVIGRNVWISRGAIILPGVSIGDHAVIGAGSVVVADVPARTLAAGNPARHVRDLVIADDWRRP